MIIKSPTAYIGIFPYTSPEVVVIDRAPTIKDLNYTLGTLWLQNRTANIYMLGSLRKDMMSGIQEATWILLHPGGSGGASSFPTDNGTATIMGGQLNVFGDLINVMTSGTGNTITIDLFDDVTIFGTFTMSALGAGVVQQQAVGGFTSDNGTDGQLLIGSNASGPAWASVTTGGTLTITPGANTLQIEINAAAGLVITADDAGTATPAAGIIDMPDQTNISLNAVSNIVQFNLNNIVVIGNDLTVTESFGTLNGNMTVAQGVTFSLLSTGVVTVAADGEVGFVNGTDGQTLIGGGTIAPFASITSSTITITPGANTLDLSIGVTPDNAGSFNASGGSPSQNTGGTITVGSLSVFPENFDIGNNYFEGNGAGTPASFTAPEDGKYHLTLTLWGIQGVSTSFPSNVEWQIRINAGTKTFMWLYNERSVQATLPQTSGAYTASIIAPIVELDMGDVVTYSITHVTTITNTDFTIFSSAGTASYLSGYQVA